MFSHTLIMLVIIIRYDHTIMRTDHSWPEHPALWPEWYPQLPSRLVRLESPLKCHATPPLSLFPRLTQERNQPHTFLLLSRAGFTCGTRFPRDLPYPRTPRSCHVSEIGLVFCPATSEPSFIGLHPLSHSSDKRGSTVH